jgi:dihydroorotase-like cyclic amidohydrolase
MNILIKQATIVDSTSPFNGKVMDILIEKGIITQLKKTIANEKNYNYGSRWFMCFCWLVRHAGEFL